MTIKLDQFLKLQGLASTGGQAKYLIQNSEVKVNDLVETRRGRQLRNGDTVEVFETKVTVDLDPAAE